MSAPTSFDATSLASHPLKNRFIVAPMTRVSATGEGVPTPEMGDYYEAFALGGFAAVISEGVYTDAVASLCAPHQPGIVTHAQIGGWRTSTERVKKQGTIFLCQLMHAGALSEIMTHTLAPSAVKPLGKPTGTDGFPVPTAMTRSDIHQAIEGYAQAARNAVVAGFDGVELHGANGYLPDQFLTSYTNVRTDEYGGPVENRFRFVAQTLAAIRAVVPVDFIVGLRLSEGKVNNLAYRWEEGPAMAESIFREVKKAAPDYLHMAAEGGGWKRECLYADGRSSTGIAKQMLACPIIANGGLHDTELSHYILTEQHGDLLAIGRYALANPDLPDKLQNGEKVTPFDKRMITPSVTLATTQAFLASG